MRNRTCHRNSRKALLIAQVLLVHVWSDQLAAQPLATESTLGEEPSRLFAEAAKRFDAHEYARALEVFTRVTELRDSANVRLYLGYCFKELGQERKAHQAFSVAAKLALKSGDTRYVQAREAALYQISLLELKLAQITISIVDAPQDVTLQLDGESLDTAQLGSPIVIDPGLHRVEATARGETPLVRDVTLEQGGKKTIALLFDNRSHAASTKTDAEPRSELAQSSKLSHTGWLAPVGYAAGGVGLIGLGVFTVAGLKAKSTYLSLQSDCGNGCVDAAHHDSIDSGKRYQTAANIGLAIGLIGAAACGTLLTLSVLEDKSTKTALFIGPGAATFQYIGSF